MPLVFPGKCPHAQCYDDDGHWEGCLLDDDDDSYWVATWDDDDARV